VFCPWGIVDVGKQETGHAARSATGATCSGRYANVSVETNAPAAAKSCTGFGILGGETSYGY
jgi:hypothetical protein